MFARIFSLAVLILGAWAVPAVASDADHANYLHDCQLSEADLASPEAIWMWATRVPPSETAFYDNELDAMILIWDRFGKEAMKPYMKTKGWDGLREGMREGHRQAFGQNHIRDTMYLSVPMKRRGESERLKKNRKAAEKRQKAALAGKISSDHFPTRPNGGMKAFAFSRVGDCRTAKDRATSVVYRIDRLGFNVGPFPTEVCDAAFAKGVVATDSKKDNVAIRRWRDDYRARKSEGANSCAFLPAVFADDPALASGMEEAMEQRRLELYAQSRLNSANYCFIGVRENPDINYLMNSMFWKLRDDPERHHTDVAVEQLDPGDNRITQWTVYAAYELWKYYRNGIQSLRDPMYVRRCHSNIYCGFPKDAEVNRTLSNWRNVRKSDMARAFEASVPETMTDHTKEFIRQNLGDCAIEPQNLTPIDVKKAVKLEARPQWQCNALASYLDEKSSERRLHQDDAAWLSKWRTRNADGTAQCYNDYPYEAYNNMQVAKKLAHRKRMYELDQAAQRAQDAAERAAYKQRYNEALYSNRVTYSNAPPRSAREIESDIIRWENYKAAQRCGNPTAGC